MQYEPFLILATDLDGTFLEGNSTVKSLFYSELLKLKDQILLIYVTGRGIDTVRKFCLEGYLPTPHFILGDHGSHIVEGNTFNPIKALQDSIIASWNNANERIKSLLANEIGIELQPLNPPYRVAYYYDASLLRSETIQKIKAEGFEIIFSSSMYLDILPKNVNKGSSLLKLLEYLQLKQEAVITCGDSLNDLSLFQTGLKGIVVGNAEPDLLAETKHIANVYHSTAPGLLGILEGLHFYNKADFFNFQLTA